MGHKYAKNLSLEDAKKAIKHITEVITGFLCSVEQVFPKRGYGGLAKNIADLNNTIQGCSGPFLKDQEIDSYINLLLDPFTHMNPDVEKKTFKICLRRIKKFQTFLQKTILTLSSNYLILNMLKSIK